MQIEEGGGKWEWEWNGMFGECASESVYSVYDSSLEAFSRNVRILQRAQTGRQTRGLLSRSAPTAPTPTPTRSTAKSQISFDEQNVFTITLKAADRQ